MSLVFYTYALLLALFYPTLATPDSIRLEVDINLGSGTAYCLRDEYKGKDFFDAFRWESFNDPTHGRVNYLDKESAIRTNLSYASDDKFFMGADSTRTVTSGRGRDSVRISSYATFDEGVVVLDLEHMPTGCGTWPAFWTLSNGGSWPKGGEIDIIEGVNKDKTNLASLHTTPNCKMPVERHQTGTTMSTDCDTSVNYNQGCGTRFRSPKSWGQAFNDNGGGWFVMQKSKADGIKVWFWSRSSYEVPLEVRHGAPTVFPRHSWGIPDAYFPMDPKSCKYEDHFDEHMMIFDVTFCGDWAGNDWPASTCAADYGPSCTNFVDSQPGAFSEAYWEINALRIYVPEEEF